MSDHPKHELRQAEACDWIVRLQAGDETDALAFDAWLDAAPENARAYDTALATWAEYGRHAGAVDEALRERPAVRPITRRYYVAGAALAAAAAVAVVALPQLQTADATQTYATARGERRSVTLADGSKIDINGGARMTVALARDSRRVILDEGQAVFDVAADARRPFTIAAGDRTVRVVGTQFDVRRRDGRLSVTVARGLVEVRPSAGGQGAAYRLRPGQRLDHVEGAPTVRVTAAAPEEALGWRTGRLVYRGQPLSEVVADLNAQFRTPIRVEGAELAATPISGVLILDDEAAVIRRLALLVSAEPVPSAAGVVLRR